MLKIYDAYFDEYREATQDDIDQLDRCVQAFGMLVTFLRKSPRVDAARAADIAVLKAQDKINWVEARARLDQLRIRR
jgi:hypothetical protein